MIKTFSAGIIICFLSFSTLMSQELNTPAQKAKILLNQIQAKKSQRPGWDEPSTAIESGASSLRKMPEFVELQHVTSAAWPQIVSNIQSVAPSEVSKAILFVALQSLPADDYLQFVDKAVGLAENRTIKKRLLKWALFPADKNVRGVLDYNYNKPVVKDILQRVEVLYADDPNMVKYCEATLSGESKKEAEAYLNDNPSELRPVPAGGSANKDAATSPTPASP